MVRMLLNCIFKFVCNEDTKKSASQLIKWRDVYVLVIHNFS